MGWQRLLFIVVLMLTVPFATPVALGSEIWVTNQTANQVHVLDGSSLKELATIPTGANPNAVVFSADFARAYVSNMAAGTVTVIEALGRRSEATLRSGAGAHTVTLSPDGRLLYVANSGEGTLSVFNTRSLKRSAKIALGGIPVSVAFSGNGKFAYVGSQDGTLSVIDVAMSAVVRKVPGLGGGIDVVPTVDGSKLYVATGFNNEVKLVEAATGKVISVLAAGSDAHSLRLSPDGKSVWVVNRLSGSIMILDAGSARVVRRLDGIGDKPDVMVFSSDGMRAYMSLHGKVPAGYPDTLSGRESGLAVIDTNTGSVVTKVRIEGDPHGVAVRP